MDPSTGTVVGLANPQKAANRDTVKWICLAAGLVVLIGSLWIPAPAGLKPAAMRTLAIMVTTVLWWVTEVLPIPVTAMMVPVMVHAMGITLLPATIREGFGDSLIPFLVGVLGLSLALPPEVLKNWIPFVLSLPGLRTDGLVYL